MEIYFYGTYEGSAKGFMLMKYQEGRLVFIPAEQQELLPPQADAFFSYDCFNILWQEIVSDQKREKVLLPRPDAAMLGIRNLQGQISGRDAYINAVFWSAIEEEKMLRKLFLRMLDDYQGFVSGLIECLYLEAEAYQIHKERFEEWLQGAANRKKDVAEESLSEEQSRVRRLIDRPYFAVTERDLIRFALCTSTWQNVRNYRYQEPIWKIPPRSVFEGSYFLSIFG